MRTTDENKEYEQLITSAKEKGLIVFTDGSMDNSKPTNPMKFSYAIFEGDVILEEKVMQKDFNGNPNSINKAEALGIIHALVFLDNNNCNSEHITFFTDSKIVFNICERRKPPKQNTIFYSTAKSLLRGIERFDNLSFHWIPRELNTYADGLMR